MRNILTAGLCALLLPWAAAAGEAEVIDVRVKRVAGLWTFDVTVKHSDEGWDHYADGWEIRSPNGDVLGTRTLHHPHVEEQPFTRSLSGVDVGPLREVEVFVHDSVHGWNPTGVLVELRPPEETN